MNEEKTFSRRTLAFVLTVIFFANFLNYLDRTIVSSLENPLIAEFGLSKSQYGFLWTIFTIGYMIFAPIVGYFTDRHRRTRIFAICILIWSGATISSGLAPSTSILYFSRFLIGIGEAGCLVIGPTLLADFFPRHARGRALSAFYLGMPLGGAAGYLVGAFVTEHFGGWRNAFLAAGLPGFLLAPLIWTMTDPPRGGNVEDDTSLRVQGFRPYIDLFKNRTLILLILAQAFAVIILVPIMHFGVEFFQTIHKLKLDEAAIALTGTLVGGVIGSLLSGYVGDKLAKRFTGGYALICAVGYALGLPFVILGTQTSSLPAAVTFFSLAAFCFFLCMPAINTQIANVVSARQRAMAYAMAVFILHLLGDTSTPPLFGYIADQIGKQATFFWFSFVLILSSGLCYLATRTAKEDIERFAGVQK